VLFILAFLLVAAVALFYSLQKYVVTTADGVSLQLPFLADETQEDEAAEATALPSVELVVEDPDYDSFVGEAGAEAERIGAYFVSDVDIASGKLSSCADEAETLGADALVLDMKPESGLLSWASDSETAHGYATAGTAEIADSIAELKERGFYLIARLSVCVDDLVCERNPSAALTTESGDVFSDSVGSWLDPYNSFVRGYISELMDELADMGFDEILLSNLSQPENGEYNYSQTMSSTPSPTAAVSALAIRLVSDAEKLGITLSAELADGEADATGQDTALFCGVFARIYCPCAGDTASAHFDGLKDNLDVGDASARFVAIVSSPVEDTSWLVK
jgi:hypothetical protein